MPVFNITTVSGTANQVLANGNVGTIETGLVTLSLPQDINTSSTPSFSRITSTVTTGTAPFTVSSTTPVSNLSIGGTASFSSNTLVSTTTSNALYPLALVPTATTGNQSLLMDIALRYNPLLDALYLPSNGSLNTGTLTFSASNALLSLQNDAGTYVQAIIQNTNGSSLSSADLVVNNELSTDSTYYGDFGINSATFVGTGSLFAPGVVYLTAADADLSIGTLRPNAIHFVVNSSSTDAFTIGTAGQWGIAGSNGTTGQLFTSSGPSAAPSWTTVSYVSSVSLALPSIFTVSGSPVTTSGTLTGTLANQVANTHFTGPASGGPATPTFRTISLLQNDLSDVVLSAPSSGQILSYNSGTSKWNNTTVLNGNASGTIGVSPAGGGTAWTLISGNSYRADFVHNLGTTNVVITVYDTNNSAIVIPNLVVTTNTNTVRVTVTGNTRTLKVVVVAQGSALVAGGSTPSSVITAEDGVTISTAATKLNFTGQAINVVDAGSGTTNITIGSRFTFFANSLDTPNNVDYAINALAPVTTDPTFTSLNVRSFSNTVEQGVACLISVPTGATQLIVKIRGRAQTAPGTASVVQPRLYYRLLPNNSAVATWSAAQELANIAIPTNANFQYSTQTILLSTLGLTAGNLYQFEFTRRVAGVTGTNLAANFLMAEITLELA